jgi:F-type H+-transporting ATPase subunit b
MNQPQPHALLVLATALLGASPAHAAALELVPDPTRLIFLLVLFVLLVPLLNGLLFKPLLAVLEERNRRIAGARERAAQLATDAAALVTRHDEALHAARERFNGERTRTLEDARGAHQAAIQDARRQAEQELAATREQVGDALAAARDQLQAEAGPLARDVAERLLGRRLA